MKDAAARTGTPVGVGDDSVADRDGYASASDGTADLKESAAEQAERDDGAVADSTQQAEETPAAERDEASPDAVPVPVDSVAGGQPGAPAAGTGGRGGDGPATTANRPGFVRPPGMAPPPERPEAPGADGARPPAGTAGGPAVGTAAGPAAGSAAGTATAPPARPGPAAGAPASGPAVPYAIPPFHPGGPADTAGSRTGPGEHALAVGTARVREAVRTARASSVPRGPRRARLGIRRLDPWSVMKFSFMVSLVLFVVMIVAASVLYLALDTMGVFASVNSTLSDLIASSGGEGEGGFRISAKGVIGTAGILGAINVILFTALATLGAFIYNVCADLVGGIEITLAERD